MITRSQVRRALACALTAVAAAPAVAVAQEEGVTIDPDSPSGKEYAIPIDRARLQADPAKKPGSRAPLFGAGIGDGGKGDGSSGGPGGGGTPASGSADRAGAASRAPGNRSRLPRSDEVARIANSGPGQFGGMPPGLLFGGVGALLLAGATGIGLMLRRRQR